MLETCPQGREKTGFSVFHVKIKLSMIKFRAQFYQNGNTSVLQV